MTEKLLRVEEDKLEIEAKEAAKKAGVSDPTPEQLDGFAPSLGQVRAQREKVAKKVLKIDETRKDKVLKYLVWEPTYNEDKNLREPQHITEAWRRAMQLKRLRKKLVMERELVQSRMYDLQDCSSADFARRGTPYDESIVRKLERESKLHAKYGITDISLVISCCSD